MYVTVYIPILYHKAKEDVKGKKKEKRPANDRRSFNDSNGIIKL